MQRPRVTNKGKATTAGTLASALTAWLALEASYRFGIPGEVTTEVITVASGAVGGLLARWASRLDPSE